MSSRDRIVEELAEEFVERLRRGEAADPAEYQHRYPELATEIGECFPALRMLEADKTLPARKPEELGYVLKEGAKLGDYRIVRELGRGGMGVVYEAEQESLGRRVALKVLSWHLLSKVSQHKRFVREARAAARLHHSNIVPVFGVGHEDGCDYYVMQFIDGVSLDQVISRLRCLRRPTEDALAANEASSQIAMALQCGDYANLAKRERLQNDTVANTNEHSIDPRLVSTPSQEENEDPQSDLLDTLEGKFQKEASRSAGFFRCVARLGVQAAKALHYAHEQGVIHRDVKPANLLLDRQGTVWVTDFGVAKAKDQEELTKTGDLLGTLRYMSPEQFDGRSDARSDIYALGLTLYELLLQRPAFDEAERSKLLQQVANREPTRLRRLDSGIPKDLETIIHKMIERDLARRYQSADEAADDLQRYLDDQPIRARRRTIIHCLGKWGKRNPASAALLAVLVFIAISAPALAIYLGGLVVETRRAYRQSEHNLYLAKRSEATAGRFSGRPGQQFNTLAALAMAAELHNELELENSAIDEMRAEAIAALSLPDLRIEKTWKVPEPGRLSLVHFDSELRNYCAIDGENLSIRSFDGNLELSRLRVGYKAEKARFSPDGRLICVTGEGSCAQPQVWDWHTGKLIYRIEDEATLFASDFSPESKLLAIGHEDGAVTLHDLESRKLIDRLKTAAAPMALAFHPSEPILAVNCMEAYCTEIWDMDSRKLLRSLKHPSNVFGLQWSHDGKLLASVEGFDIYLWDKDQPSNEPLQVLKGHTWVVSEINFHPNGRLLYSHSWREGKTRVWDLLRGKQLFVVDGYTSRFDQQGQRLAFRTNDSVGVWEVRTGASYIWPGLVDAATPEADFCSFSHDGEMLAVAGDDAVHLWDSRDWRLLARLEMFRPFSVLFPPKSYDLLVASEEALYKIPVQKIDGDLHFDQRQVIPTPRDLFALHLSQDASGKNLFADLAQKPDTMFTGRAMLWGDDTSEPILVEGDPKMRFNCLTPDGQWVVTGNWLGQDACVFDAHNGELAKRLPTSSSTTVACSPNGKWLATAGTDALCLWETETWEKVYEIERSSIVSAVTFSPDSRMLAVSAHGAGVDLRAAEDGQLLTTLATNDEPTYVRWLTFNPKGNQLAICYAADGVRVWDLEHLRGQLQSIHLDWTIPHTQTPVQSKPKGSRR